MSVGVLLKSSLFWSALPVDSHVVNLGEETTLLVNGRSFTILFHSQALDITVGSMVRTLACKLNSDCQYRFPDNGVLAFKESFPA
jgi:hypothetical protein